MWVIQCVSWGTSSRSARENERKILPPPDHRLRATWNFHGHDTSTLLKVWHSIDSERGGAQAEPRPATFYEVHSFLPVILSCTPGAKLPGSCTGSNKNTSADWACSLATAYGVTGTNAIRSSPSVRYSCHQIMLPVRSRRRLPWAPCI
jgi:hypothetical protein